MNTEVCRLNDELHELRAALFAFCTDPETKQAFDHPKIMLPTMLISDRAMVFGMTRLEGALRILEVSDALAMQVRYEWVEGTFLDHHYITEADEQLDDEERDDPVGFFIGVAFGKIYQHQDANRLSDWFILAPDIWTEQYIGDLGIVRKQSFDTRSGNRCVVLEMEAGNKIIIGLVDKQLLQNSILSIPAEPRNQIYGEMAVAWDRGVMVHVPGPLRTQLQ